VLGGRAVRGVHQDVRVNDEHASYRPSMAP
jgi:hypothetical protein